MICGLISGWLRWLRRPHATGRASGVLTRLARDARGNTLAIGAAALIPMAGMVGGGIDLSRMYIVKTRMQHACDAGALSGRKAMGSGVWTQNGGRPNTIAQNSYDANFPANAYGSTSTSRAFSESAGTVTGTATTVLPLTLMRVLGRTSETITVTCDAEMRLPNTDVMFVLDTTGSMADTPSGDTRTKMASLKEAVKCFYEVVARLDTDAVCTTGTPAGGAGGQVQIRFGFVPYATNVNVGRLLNTGWMADDWDYQSRKYVGGEWEPDWSAYSYHVRPTSGSNKDKCIAPNASTTVRQFKSEPLYYDGTWYCVNYYRDWISRWNYEKVNLTVSGLKNGTAWRASFNAPLGPAGTDKQIDWDGCIEERATVKQSSYDPIPSGAKDLDIDLAPSSTSGTKWGPALPGVIYTRQSTDAGAGTAGWSLTPVKNTTAEYANASYYACPVAAQKLDKWDDATKFDDYVDSLTPEGNTYHDIGLLWGARLLSPTGLWSTNGGLTPQGGEIERNLIFMTDGDPCTGVTNYTAYGVNWFDRRQTDSNTVPTEGCSTTGTLTQQVNARMAGLCTAIKNKNITLWVIAFGSITTATETRLQTCATSGRYFRATNAATLQSTFKSIADQISMLRLTK